GQSFRCGSLPAAGPLRVVRALRGAAYKKIPGRKVPPGWRRRWKQPGRTSYDARAAGRRAGATTGTAFTGTALTGLAILARDAVRAMFRALTTKHRSSA